LPPSYRRPSLSPPLRKPKKKNLSLSLKSTAQEVGTTPNAASGGPTVAVEFTPIKDWLEIEIGTGRLFGSGTTDWSTDILFKKPFELSNTAELMVSAGPAFDSTFGGTTKIGVEFTLDFMFWPWPDRKYGWSLSQATLTALSTTESGRLA
jgi:hypothetical protein